LGSVLAGEATPAQIGAFLTLLHAKGETTDEVTGLARAMVEAAVPLTLPVGPTGGRSGGDRR
jgi:anthranilate phosphoribosyltransferase